MTPSTDVPIALAKVCFEEKSGSGADLPPCRTLTPSGHHVALYFWGNAST